VIHFWVKLFLLRRWNFIFSHRRTYANMFLWTLSNRVVVGGSDTFRQRVCRPLMKGFTVSAIHPYPCWVGTEGQGGKTGTWFNNKSGRDDANRRTANNLLARTCNEHSNCEALERSTDVSVYERVVYHVVVNDDRVHAHPFFKVNDVRLGVGKNNERTVIIENTPITNESGGGKRREWKTRFPGKR